MTITIKPAPYPYGCNGCPDGKATTDLEFSASGGCGIRIELCDECVEKLKELLS